MNALEIEVQKELIIIEAKLAATPKEQFWTRVFYKSLLIKQRKGTSFEEAHLMAIDEVRKEDNQGQLF